MNKALAIFVFFLTITSCATSQKKTCPLTQEKTIPKEAFEKLANDLSKIQEEIEVAHAPEETTPGIRGVGYDIWLEASKQADFFQITKDKAAIYAGADVSTKKIVDVAHTNSPLHIVDKQPGWYAVALSDIEYLPWRFRKFRGLVPIEEDTHAAQYDTGWVQANAGVPIKSPEKVGFIEDLKNELKELIVGKVRSMYEEYKNNPYFSITGFSVEVGVPPSASLDFEFKK